MSWRIDVDKAYRHIEAALEILQDLMPEPMNYDDSDMSDLAITIGRVSSALDDVEDLLRND